MAETQRQVPWDAGWPQQLQHRPDPNRVGGLQIPTTAPLAKTTPTAQSLPAPNATAQTRSPVPSPAQVPQTQPGQKEPSYYDISFLKKPLWKWEIASYFFLGGLSAGAYTIARLAERAGGEKYRDLTRAGTYVSLLAALPCAPLLIHDLGDPKRFHHMLRVFKPGTPMSLGTWTLMSYSGMATAAVVREYLRDHRVSDADRSKLSKLTNATLLAIHDAAGVPLALLVASYTGVLLSCTANPLWSKNPWLSPLFTASAFATGTAATQLAITAREGPSAEASAEALEKIDTAAHVAEAVALAGYLRHAGPMAKPLTQGKMKKHLWAAIAGIVGAELIKLLPFRGRFRKLARALSAVAGLAGGFSLRWAMVYGGHEAADDPALARQLTNAKPPQKGFAIAAGRRSADSRTAS